MKAMKKREAKQILHYMNEILKEHGYVTQGDYYDLLGSKVCGYTDKHYGWFSLDKAKIKMKGFFKYVVSLPNPVMIPETFTN